MERFKNNSNKFLNSYYFPILVFLVALISHTFSIELFGCITLIVSACIGLLVCNDLKFLISPLIMFTFMFSEKSVSSGTFYSTGYIVAMIVLIVFFLGLLVAHFVIYKDSVDIGSFVKSKLFLGLLCLCIAFFLNGLFNFDQYVIGNIIFALAMLVCYGLIFFLLSSNLTPNKELKNYLFFILFLTSLLVILQFYISFIHQFRFENGALVKESILVGWGIWNNIGGELAFLLPIHFYFASTVKKYGWIFYLSGVFSYLTIALSLSRSSLLVSTAIIIACAIISCFAGENKKINRIFTGAIAIIGIIGIIALWDKLSSVLGDYLSRGMDDNGRFEIYKKGLLNFCDNPIFGGGFFSADAQDHQFVAFMPDRYHNTIIQMMGTCGIVGLLAYLYHRFETVKLMLRKRSLYTLFCALCLIAFLGTSLLDNHFFNIHPSFVYISILVVIEKCENDYEKPLNAQ